MKMWEKTCDVRHLAASLATDARMETDRKEGNLRFQLTNLRGERQEGERHICDLIPNTKEPGESSIVSGE